ncbi:MAG: hypothetical protein K9K82_11280 [Desulfobacteraceae bacterium]|nr:hypothetical protein [Desulfobacteraceae bacterium]
MVVKDDVSDIDHSGILGDAIDGGPPAIVHCIIIFKSIVLRHRQIISHSPLNTLLDDLHLL